MFKKVGKKRIINSGSHRPKPTQAQQLAFLEKWNNITPPAIKQQAKKTGNVIYGCRGINGIVGKSLSRPTHDFDVYSKNPKKHATQLERHIDKTTGLDMAYVEEIPYTTTENKKGKLYRVVTRPEGDVDADFNIMPKNIDITRVKGINYVSLKSAEKKFPEMMKEDKRKFNTMMDTYRIWHHRIMGGKE